MPGRGSSVPPDSTLPDRLDSIRQALGADRLAVIRRLPSAGPGPPPFEVLATSSAEGPIDPPERALPLEFVIELVARARPHELRRDEASPRWASRMGAWDLSRLEGWALPSDRWPTVFFVAAWRGRRTPSPARIRVAMAGMEALARALAVPDWMPRSDPMSSSAPPASGDAGREGEVRSLDDVLAGIERELLVRALQAAEGNKSVAARRLRVSRQGLYRKLRRHGLLRRSGRGLDTAGPDD